jgi:hypothetical protein
MRIEFVLLLGATLWAKLAFGSDWAMFLLP